MPDPWSLGFQISECGSSVAALDPPCSWGLLSFSVLRITRGERDRGSAVRRRDPSPGHEEPLLQGESQEVCEPISGDRGSDARKEGGAISSSVSRVSSGGDQSHSRRQATALVPGDGQVAEQAEHSLPDRHAPNLSPPGMRIRTPTSDPLTPVGNDDYGDEEQDEDKG